jgi:hypothetical protein
MKKRQDQGSAGLDIIKERRKIKRNIDKIEKIRK